MMTLKKEHLVYTDVVNDKVTAYFMVPNADAREIEIWEYDPETSEAEHTESFVPGSMFDDIANFDEVYAQVVVAFKQQCGATTSYTLN